MKKALPALAAAILLLSIVVIYLIIRYSNLSEGHFACSYPAFARVHNGMNSDAVSRALGQPDQKIVKQELGGNQFGQGNLELQIKSGWLYSLPYWNGGLEIYFDTNETVIGKNCGEG